MQKCLTKPFGLKEVSGCLVEKPECGFAHKLGFSFICHHPDHTQFRARAVGVMTRNEENELYDRLKQKRRNAFVAGLDEDRRALFFLKADFLGRPMTGMDTDESQR